MIRKESCWRTEDSLVEYASVRCGDRMIKTAWKDRLAVEDLSGVQ
jgi:hypothetical protein